MSATPEERRAAQELERAVATGKPFESFDLPIVILGSVLRSLYLGSPSRTSAESGVADTGGSAAEPVRHGITSAGLVIDGGPRRLITVSGAADDALVPIDLSYLAGAEGGPLPPLVLRRCILDSDLRLTGSHFAFVWLEDCEIRNIDADHCRIDNHCRLVDLRPHPDAPAAQIRMVAARIEGTVDLRGTRLIAPADRPNVTAPRRYADRYALSLASCRIAGRLLLDDHFTALGGVSLYQAAIEGSVSLQNARIESRNTSVPALDGEELRLAGSLIWTNSPVSRSGRLGAEWSIAGRIVLRRAQIGGDCKLENCRWAGREAHSLGSGLVDHIDGGIDARLTQIDGQLRICSGCLVARWNAPPTRRIEEDVMSGAYGPSIDLWKARVGKGIRAERGAEFSGPIFLNSSVISHGLIMRAKVSLPPSGASGSKMPEAIDLSDASISGLVRFDADVTGSVSLRRISVEGTVELHAVRFRCAPLAPGDQEQDRKTGCATLLDLGAASISGTLHIGELSLEWPRHRPETVSALTRYADRLKPLSTLNRWRGGRLVSEFHLEDRVRVSSVVVAGKPRLLGGTPAEFEAAWKGTELKRSADAEEYARLYMDFVVDGRGPRQGFRAGSAQRSGAGWRLSDCEFFCNGSWERSDMLIDPQGVVSFENARQLARADPASEAPYTIGPFAFPVDELADGAPPDAGARRGLEKLLRDYVQSHVFRPFIIDMRGLHCRAFGDNEAQVWSGLGDQRWWRLLLDGIDFDHFDRTEPKHRSRVAELERADAGDVIERASRQPPAAHGTPGLLSYVHSKEGPKVRRRTQMLLSFGDTTHVARWRGLERLARDPEYSPQPFERFARAYIARGERPNALSIAKWKTRLYWNRLKVDAQESVGMRRARVTFLCLLVAAVLVLVQAAVRPRMAGLPLGWGILFFTVGLWLLFLAVVWNWGRLLLGLGILFEATFGFGLKPRRAAQTLLICLAFGVIGANGLSSSLRPVPMLGFDPRLPHTMAEHAPVHESTSRDVAVEGCNVASDTAIDRALYAFDVFVPLLDVRSECAFYIEEHAEWVRWLRTLYAALGWLVVSLTLLTFSGVLRRDIEG